MPKTSTTTNTQQPHYMISTVAATGHYSSKEQKKDLHYQMSMKRIIDESTPPKPHYTAPHRSYTRSAPATPAVEGPTTSPKTAPVSTATTTTTSFTMPPFPLIDLSPYIPLQCDSEKESTPLNVFSEKQLPVVQNNEPTISKAEALQRISAALKELDQVEEQLNELRVFLNQDMFFPHSKDKEALYDTEVDPLSAEDPTLLEEFDATIQQNADWLSTRRSPLLADRIPTHPNTHSAMTPHLQHSRPPESSVSSAPLKTDRTCPGLTDLFKRIFKF